ncbi:MAG TPA: C45 family autoproteolytic acyltransferase/hydrolase, partial [Candidatus Hydrogenedentes bacterium]|nr:C45 family autoproteolytic acyltransferase/hydrolase [Candidatus Hydrogenedentota bacterium]
GPVWYPTKLSSIDQGVYVARPAEPIVQWTAFFVQLKYRSPLPTQPYIFTTQVNVLPNTYHKPQLYENRGYRTEAGQGIYSAPVVVLNGTPYQMGRRYGQLMEKEIQAFLPAFIAKAQQKDPVKFSNTELDKAWTKVSPYIDSRLTDEIQGIAESVATTTTDATYWTNVLRRAHMIPVLQSYSCASVAAWKSATADGGMLHARDLDWPLDARLQDYPCIVVYIPQNGTPHVNVTFAGMVGAHTGFNLFGLSLAEISADAPEPYDLRGEPFFSFFRAILYDAKNLDEAVDIIHAARRIKNYHYVVADGRWQQSAAKILANASLAHPADFVVVGDNDPNDGNSPNIKPGVVFDDQERGAWDGSDGIEAKYGTLNAEKMQAIARKIAKPGSNLLNVVYDANKLMLYFAYAEGAADASAQPFQNLELSEYLKPGSAK